jgi:hypothetical protein
MAAADLTLNLWRDFKIGFGFPQNINATFESVTDDDEKSRTLQATMELD